MNPFGYHLTNLLLHASNAAVFYLLTRIMWMESIWATRFSRMAVAGPVPSIFQNEEREPSLV
jgi:hypothetical protein